MKAGMAVNGIPNAEQRRCYDCQFCQAKLSWWCVNEKAIEERGTSIPGVIKCPHWEPIVTKEELYDNASILSRLLGSYKSGYLEVDLSPNFENNIE